MERYSPEYHLTIRLNGYRLSYMRAGRSRNRLVFIHGWAASKEIWDDIIADLSRDHMCMALDLPGMGDSEPRTDGAYDVLAMAESVEYFIDAMHHKPVTLIGHSTGGLISLILAHRRPDLVSRLVLVSAVIDGTLGWPFTPGVWVPPVGRLVMRFIKRLQTRALRPYLLSMRPFLYDRRKALTIPYFKRLYPYYLHYDVDGMSNLLLSLTKQDMTAVLSAIDVPTLITSGEADRSVPVRQAELAAELMPDAHLAYIPRAGHVPHLENLPVAVSVLREFLDKTREDGNGRR